MGRKRGFFKSHLSIRSGIFFLLILSGFLSYSQGGERPTEEQIEQRKVEMERFMRHMERDPEGARDSMKRARIKWNLAEALERVDWYNSNNNLDTLKEIDLSYAQLTKIPEFVYQAKNLETLVLDYNLITKLPRQLRELDSLKKIYWRENKLGSIRPKISKLPQVKKLSLADNSLIKLPKTKRLAGLEILELKENEFEEIPINRLKKNKKLKELAMGANPLLLGKAKYKKLAFLKIFKGNNCELTSIDESFYEMTGLDEIQLQENLLERLPEGISSLENLAKFSCYKNKLTTLPSDFFELKKLKVADLYYNQLEVIPKELGNLDSLEVLYLSHNKIFSLPNELGQLTKLKELYLHHNRLSVLPASLKNLDSLKVVRVNNNYLLDFPIQFLNIESLEEVDVDNNELTTLPAGVELMSSLTLITFQNNAIDLQSEQNAHIPAMIERMLKRGVFCKPAIYQESTGL